MSRPYVFPSKRRLRPSISGMFEAQKWQAEELASNMQLEAMIFVQVHGLHLDKDSFFLSKLLNFWVQNVNCPGFKMLCGKYGLVVWFGEKVADIFDCFRCRWMETGASKGMVSKDVSKGIGDFKWRWWRDFGVVKSGESWGKGNKDNLEIVGLKCVASRIYISISVSNTNGNLMKSQARYQLRSTRDIAILYDFLSGLVDSFLQLAHEKVVQKTTWLSGPPGLQREGMRLEVVQFSRLLATPPLGNVGSQWAKKPGYLYVVSFSFKCQRGRAGWKKRMFQQVQILKDLRSL